MSDFYDVTVEYAELGLPSLEQILTAARTGRRVARIKGKEEREIVEVPALRIIDDELWLRVKNRQAALQFEVGHDARGNALNRTHRRKFLLSKLLVCGECGGGYTIVAKDRYGCASRRSKGTCGNNQTITRQAIEARVLGGLKDKLGAGTGSGVR